MAMESWYFHILKISSSFDKLFPSKYTSYFEQSLLSVCLIDCLGRGGMGT